MERVGLMGQPSMGSSSSRCARKTAKPMARQAWRPAPDTRDTAVSNTTMEPCAITVAGPAAEGECPGPAGARAGLPRGAEGLERALTDSVLHAELEPDGLRQCEHAVLGLSQVPAVILSPRTRACELNLDLQDLSADR